MTMAERMRTRSISTRVKAGDDRFLSGGDRLGPWGLGGKPAGDDSFLSVGDGVAPGCLCGKPAGDDRFLGGGDALEGGIGLGLVFMVADDLAAAEEGVLPFRVGGDLDFVEPGFRVEGMDGAEVVDAPDEEVLVLGGVLGGGLVNEVAGDQALVCLAVRGIEAGDLEPDDGGDDEDDGGQGEGDEDFH
jgi:hypothetical protein